MKAIKAMMLAVTLLAVSVIPGFAGAVGGPKYGKYRIAAEGVRTFTICFHGGETAHIDIEGDGDTDLDLYVYDSRGNLVVSATDYSDKCCVMWVPIRGECYTIKVLNYGGVYNDFEIATN